MNLNSLRLSLVLSCLAGAAVAEDMPIFKLDMKDGVMTPLKVEAAAGKPFKIEITNSGKSPVEFESLELRKEKVLAPGGSGSVVFRKLSPGTYVFFDEFHPDSPKGTLEVK
ncbi:MAG: cupredoxin domain-containing protein [Rhodospirillales bacterium]|jgi:hypothetical protein|nr:cupredoxin domain-containing protein [Rhodospirillales bacterium]